MNEIKVSICCLTYNHEKYIRNALDSFVMQKTSFRFEILIHDDASTDATQDIIKSYERMYPEIIKPIYQKENQYSKGVKISRKFLFPRAQGKYIAMCEGDDFWTDEYKLQKQFDALEKYSDCGICSHIVSYISENGEPLNKTKPSVEIMEKMRGSIINPSRFFDSILTENPIPFQTSSFFIRKKVIDDYVKENLEFMNLKGVGDIPLLWYCVAHGSVCFIPEQMSNYRADHQGNWGTSYFSVPGYRVEYYKSVINMVDNYNFYTDRRFEEAIGKIIKQYEFKLYVNQKKYRLLLNPKYKEVMNKQPIKGKAYILLFAFFPKMGKVFLRLKEKEKSKKSHE